jgi:2'-5' RNA ligase
MESRNIILLPSSEVKTRCIELSQKIARLTETTFILDGSKFHPHLTLYQIAFPSENLHMIESTVKKIAEKTKSFSIHLHKYSSLMGFIFLEATLDDTLMRLHSEIVTAVNPLRDGIILPSEQGRLNDSSVSELIKNSIRTYGAALAMEAFLPHITLAKLKDPNMSDKILCELEQIDMQFEAKDIAVANIGLDGTVNEMYQTFQIGQRIHR